MIASLELEDFVPARERARKSHRAHRCFSTTRDKAHHLEVRHSLTNQFAELHLELGGHSEAGSVLHGACKRVEYDRRGMPQHERTPRENEIDVFFAVGVPDPRALAPRGDDRLSSNAAKSAHRRVYSTRKELARTRHHFGGSHASGRSFRSSPA